MKNIIITREVTMNTLSRVILVILLLTFVVSLFAATDSKRIKSTKTVVMIIPDPQAPSNAESVESASVNTAYNEITSVLLSQKMAIIDKVYADQALKEIRQNKDLDIDVASVQYGKKNMADKVIQFYVIDKSANYQDFHYETRIKVINVSTAQVVLSIEKEGIDKENKEAAIQQSIRNALTEALPQIKASEEMYTVTFKGKIKLEVQNELDNLFDSIDDVATYDGYVVNVNAYEYRVSGNITVSALRKAIQENIKIKQTEIELEQQSVNSLVFRLVPKQTIHSSLAWVSGISSLAGAGVTGYFYMKAEDSYDKYKKARTPSELSSYRSDTEKYDDSTMLYGITTGVLTSWFVFEMVKVNHWKKENIISLYRTNNKTLGLAFNVHF